MDLKPVFIHEDVFVISEHAILPQRRCIERPYCVPCGDLGSVSQGIETVELHTSFEVCAICLEGSRV